MDHRRLPERTASPPEPTGRKPTTPYEVECEALAERLMRTRKVMPGTIENLARDWVLAQPNADELILDAIAGSIGTLEQSTAAFKAAIADRDLVGIGATVYVWIGVKYRDKVAADVQEWTREFPR